MPTVLISGAGRGLGLEFARQYGAAGWQVHGTVRDPGRGEALAKTGAIIHPLEVTEKASVAALAASLRGVPIDLVIANAGVIGPRAMSPDMIDRESWLETIAVNSIAPLALAGALKPNLDKGEGKKLVAITSRLGSIGLNQSGSLYVYRSAKAALNAVWKSLAIDWQPSGITCLLLHPGWVKTDMGGSGADIEADVSVAGMRAVIDQADASATGRFYNYDGAELAW